MKRDRDATDRLMESLGFVDVETYSVERAEWLAHRRKFAKKYAEVIDSGTELAAQRIVRAFKYMREGMQKDDAVAKSRGELAAESEQHQELCNEYMRMLEELEVLEAAKNGIEAENADKLRHISEPEPERVPS